MPGKSPRLLKQQDHRIRIKLPVKEYKKNHYYTFIVMNYKSNQINCET